MIPKQSGKMPPPTPCSTRPATTTSSELPSAETAQPAAKKPSEMHEHPPLAEHVAEAPEDRRRDRGREQVAGERPGDPGLVGPEALLHVPERGDDHRLREREREPGQGQDGEAARRVRARHPPQASNETDSVSSFRACRYPRGP